MRGRTQAPYPGAHAVATWSVLGDWSAAAGGRSASLLGYRPAGRLTFTGVGPSSPYLDVG